MDKVRENRLRRMAERQGLVLQKSRRRDPRALDYGVYRLIDVRRNVNVEPGGEGMSLDEVEAWLTADRPRKEHDAK
jgi:hypothetical protein